MSTTYIVISKVLQANSRGNQGRCLLSLQKYVIPTPLLVLWFNLKLQKSADKPSEELSKEMILCDDCFFFCWEKWEKEIQDS